MDTRLDNPSADELYASTERAIAATPMLSAEEEQAYSLEDTEEAREWATVTMQKHSGIHLANQTRESLKLTRN